MKLRHVFGASLCAFTCLAANAQAPAGGTAYQYGMKLDIAQVLDLKEPDQPLCKVVHAQMTYKDSGGEVHQLNYLKLAQVCSNLS